MRLQLRDRVKSLFRKTPYRATNEATTNGLGESPCPYDDQIQEAYDKLQELRRKCKDFQNHVYAEEISNPRIEFLDEEELSEVKRAARNWSQEVVSEALPGDVKTYSTLLGDYTSVLMDIKYSASVGDDPSLMNTEGRISDFKKEIADLIAHLDHEMANYDALAPFRYSNHEDQAPVLSGSL